MSALNPAVAAPAPALAPPTATLTSPPSFTLGLRSLVRPRSVIASAMTWAESAPAWNPKLAPPMLWNVGPIHRPLLTSRATRTPLPPWPPMMNAARNASGTMSIALAFLTFSWSDSIFLSAAKPSTTSLARVTICSASSLSSARAEPTPPATRPRTIMTPRTRTPFFTSTTDRMRVSFSD
jgi:hypothetical protein